MNDLMLPQLVVSSSPTPLPPSLKTSGGDSRVEGANSYPLSPEDHPQQGLNTSSLDNQTLASTLTNGNGGGINNSGNNWSAGFSSVPPGAFTDRSLEILAVQQKFDTTRWVRREDVFSFLHNK